MVMPFTGAVRGKPGAPSVTPPEVTPESFAPLVWPTWHDFSRLAQAYSQELYGFSLDVRLSDMQCLQDLLCYAFVRQNLERGARILDAGNGWSRVLAALVSDYECWSIAPFVDANGNAVPLPSGYGYKVVVGSMTDSAPVLPDTYFDFVFASVATWKETTTGLHTALQTVRRVTCPGAFCLCCLDHVRREGNVSSRQIIDFYDAAAGVLDYVAPYTSLEATLTARPYVMPEKAYKQWRLPSTGQVMSEYGELLTYCLLLRTPAILQESADRKSYFSKEAPHIYVVTSCLNAQDDIGATLASVVEQKGTFFLHYHVQDRGSADNTTAILADWERRLSEGQQPAGCAGVFFSWESALAASEYAAVDNALSAWTVPDDVFIGWIKVGDILTPGVLAEVAGLTFASPDVRWILGQALHTSTDGTLHYDAETRYPRETVAAGLCDGQHWLALPPGAVFWRPSLWREAGGLDARFPNAGDWDLWRRFAERADPYQILAPLGVFRQQNIAVVEKRRHEINAVLSEQERDIRMETLQKAKKLTIRCIEPSLKGELSGLLRQKTSETRPGRDFFADMYGDREALRAFCRQRSRELAARERHVSPLFSVVTPSFNQARYIEDTIMGVLLQGEDDFEHIVMDGGSIDGTVELLAQYPHLQWTSEKDRGQTHALNKALTQARGEIIAWINSDDFHAPGAFARIKEAFARQPDEMMIIGGNLWLYENSGQTGHFPGKELTFDDLLRYWSRGIPPAQPSLFFKRAMVEAIGLPQEDLTYAMDYEYWLRATLHYPIRHIPYLLATNRLHGSSKSGSGDDWYSFFGEYHACYEQYRTHSPRWKDGLILSVVVPFWVTEAVRPAKELAHLVALLDSLGRFKLRALEVMVVTNVPDLVSGLDVSNIPVPVRAIAAEGNDAAAFVATSLRHATGRCIQFVSLTMRYPQRWHGPMVDYLLDNPREIATADQKIAHMAHVWIPADRGIVSNAVYNTALLRAQWPPSGMNQSA